MTDHDVNMLTANELAAVAATLIEHGVIPHGPLDAFLIAGGRSNLTFQLTDGRRRWVLRMPPRTGRTPSAHDVAREYRVTSALGATDIPVPPAVLLCEDESLLGGPFAISEFIDGQTIQTREELDELGAETVAPLAAELVGTLARLHNVDLEEVGLTAFGRPHGYAERQLRRWSSQWEIVGIPGMNPLAQELIARLGEQLPTQQTASVVHGDYRIDNTILSAEAEHPPHVAAVVDWELSTIGDPVADLAVMCAYRDPGFDLIVGEPSAWTSPMLPGIADLANLYEKADGVRLANWEFHLALAHFKVGVIAAGIDHRRRSGSGSGPGFETAGQSVPIYLERAKEALEGKLT